MASFLRLGHRSPLCSIYCESIAEEAPGFAVIALWRHAAARPRRERTRPPLRSLGHRSIVGFSPIVVRALGQGRRRATPAHPGSYWDFCRTESPGDGPPPADGDERGSAAGRICCHVKTATERPARAGSSLLAAGPERADEGGGPATGRPSRAYETCETGR